MATSQEYICDICMSQHITQTAIVRCPECEENFCEKCKIFHEFAKATKKHEIILIENVLKLSKFVQDIKINCPEHDERFVFYCDEHEKPCCAYCFHNAHTKCRSSTPLHTLTKNAKESSSLVDLETTLSDLLKNLTNIIENRSENLQDLVDQKKRFEMKIKTSKEAFNTYLDELEADLLDKLQKTFIEKELQIQNVLKDIERRKSSICEMQDNVTIVKSVASPFQTFMALRELTHLANTAETDLQRLFDSGSFNWIEILGTPADIQSLKDNFKSFGKIDFRFNPSKITLNVRKSREAQLQGCKGIVQSKVRVSFKINSIHGLRHIYQKKNLRRTYLAKHTKN
ncbi:zinc-binding protein A33-like [Mytilus edulis]|uniref:zinc-binding protein A33-like n=1 Tax=Mytilus edulis TaxID=6550 RepID=UPI0039F0A6F5